MNVGYSPQVESTITDAEVEAFRSSGIFDEHWYLHEYPDVAKSGIDPARHYLWIGRKLGRRATKQSAASDVIDLKQAINVFTGSALDANLDVLFIDGTNNTSSSQYRINRIASGLSAVGWKIRCIDGKDVELLQSLDLRPRFVVFFRTPYWSPYVEVCNLYRNIGAIIIYDTDDLVFDPEIIPLIDGYRYLTEDQKQGYINGVHAYRAFIVNSDMCTCSTSFLADEIRKLGVPAYRVQNTMSVESIEFFESIGYKRQGRMTSFVIGYYSGTKTHQADFAVVAPALIEFMNDNPDVVFRIVGDFELEDWPALAHWQYSHRPGDMPRVTRVGLMPHDVMVRDQLNCDLILAPLEVGNAFCEAKSELKFFEASLAKVPVIASATRTFTEATEFGRLAELAVTTDEWLKALRSIHGDYAAALRRAHLAYDKVRVNYSQQSAASQALQAYQDFGASRSGGQTEKVWSIESVVARVGVILPDFSGPSGGHRKIFTVCQALENAGITVKLYIYSERPADVIKKEIKRLFCTIGAEICAFTGHHIEQVDPHKAIICTHWKTAYDFRRLNFAGRVLYFVQDYEPMFHAVGPDFVRALSTYKMNYEIICYGEWVAAKLTDEVGFPIASIPFTLDHSIYSPPEAEGGRDIDILVFARPSQDRRCLDLIMEGLVYLRRLMPDIKIALFGEDNYPNYGIDFETLGSFSNVSELASLYRRAKVGICFSPTNPSQLGYEMLACGACLVDVRVKHYELNFGGEAFVHYCNGTPEDLRHACAALLADEHERRHRQSLAYAFTSTLADDPELGRAFLRVAGLNRS